MLSMSIKALVKKESSVVVSVNMQRENLNVDQNENSRKIKPNKLNKELVYIEKIL